MDTARLESPTTSIETTAQVSGMSSLRGQYFDANLRQVHAEDERAGPANSSPTWTQAGATQVVKDSVNTIWVNYYQVQSLNVGLEAKV